MENILKIKNLSKSFKGYKIFENLDLECVKGKIYGIVGRNGSGKSVLFKMILGFYYPDKNSQIELFGEKVGLKGSFPKDIGAIIESPGFLPQYTGFKNLKILKDINKKISDEDVRQMLIKVGLDPNLKTKVKNYSLGMIQRLGIAQALMENPKFVILDEPFNGLDKTGVSEIRELILEYKNKGTTFLLSSHVQEDIDILCDEVYEINDKKLEKIR